MTSVITVAGEVPAKDLGRVLVHEHVFCGLAGSDLDPRISLDEDAVVSEAVRWLRDVKRFGVETVVDATPINWYRRPDLLRQISEIAEVNVVASTGMYTERMGWPFHFKLLSSEQLGEIFCHELIEGIGSTTVRAGIVKIATGQPTVGKYEHRAIDAAAMAQQETGVGIITHTEGAEGAHSQLDAFEDAGVELSRLLIGHTDNNADPNYHEGIIRRGASVGLDRIGHFLIADDDDRFATIRHLIEAGYTSSIMLSHDAVASFIGKFFETEESARWQEYGFTFIFREIVPKLLDVGIDPGLVEEMLRENPRRLLAPPALTDSVGDGR